MWECFAMELRGRVLGPASTNFNDYLGTVAADDADAVVDRPSLYELAHIDRDRYTIVAVDVTVKGPTTATIYAFDRIEHGISLQAEIIELGLSRGEVPVVPFDLPEPGIEEFIRQAFKAISVRLVAQTLRDQVLVVAEPGSDPRA
jgi:hypothetical protein